MDTKIAFSVAEVQDITGICKTSLYALMNEGKLRSKQLGRRRLILRSDLEEFLSNLEACPVKGEYGHA